MMKRNLILCCLLVFTGIVYGQGIVFEKGSLEEALAKAEQQNKLLFVDISTSWCAPCQSMVREVFPKPFVGSYYNTTFVNYKLDGDSKQGKEIARKFKIGGFPAFLFLDAEGNMVYQFLGYRDPVEFVMEAEKVPQVAEYGGWEKMDSLFQQGNQDVDFLRTYYEFADKDLKPEVLNAYLKALPEEQLITKDIAMLYEDITIYDAGLMNRLADAVVKYVDRTDFKPDDYHFYFTSGVEFRLTHFLDEFIGKGERAKVDEVLGIYHKLDKIKEIRETAVDWSTGRGTIFMPQDLVDLIYARKNPSELKSFLQQMPGYMEKAMTEIKPDSILAGIEKSEFKDLYINAMYDLLEEPAQYFVTNMLDYVDYYWRHSPSDKKTRQQCIAWVKFLNGLNPYDTRNPFRAADLLARLNAGKEALAVISEVQAFQQKIKRDNKALADRLEQKMFEIRNHK